MRKKSISSLSALLLCIACAIVAAATVIILGIVYVGGADAVDDVAKFAAVRRLVSQKYIGEVDEAEMDDAVYSAMVQSLGDRWSYYMTAEEYGNYKLLVSNQYNGIGVTIQADESTGGLSIVTVTEGSPAEAAGIVVGDIMTAINGEDITGMTTSEVKSIIQSADGALVITLLRADDESETVTVTPGTIYSSPVSFEMLDNSIGYIRIENFDSGCADEAIAAIEELTEAGAESLIFDVRANPGGYVAQLTKLLDYILPKGDIFVSRSKDGTEKVTKSDADCVELPMVVLFDENSYSSAEFFAAALSEYDWAVTVGQQSTGKGRSQITVTLSDGSAIHISNNAYLTPNRVDLSEVGGLVPDYSVELETESDEQLQKAIEILS